MRAIRQSDFPIDSNYLFSSSTEKIIDFIRRNLVGSFITIIVIVIPSIGILDAIVYYLFFDIRIIEYLSFPESALLFLDKIIGNVTSIGGYVLMEVFVYNNLIKDRRTRYLVSKNRYLALIFFFCGYNTARYL